MGITIKTRVKVRVNGKEYDSLDDVPPEIREAYEKSVHLPIGDGAITINGKKYASTADMPPELRQRYEEIMAMARDGSAAENAKPGLSFKFGLGSISIDPDDAEMQPQGASRVIVIVLLIVAALGLLYWGMLPE